MGNVSFMVCTEKSRQGPDLERRGEMTTTKTEKNESYVNCLDKVSASSESWECLFGRVSK